MKNISDFLMIFLFNFYLVLFGNFKTSHKEFYIFYHKYIRMQVLLQVIKLLIQYFLA